MEGFIQSSNPAFQGDEWASLEVKQLTFQSILQGQVLRIVEFMWWLYYMGDLCISLSAFLYI